MPLHCVDVAFHFELHLPLARLYARANNGKGERSDRVDASLRHLALPSLGQWRDIFQETLVFLATGSEPWASRIHGRLSVRARDGALAGAFATMAKAISYAGRVSTRPSVLDVIELLPAYRNAMSDAHGSIKADVGIYRETMPALLTLAHALLTGSTSSAADASFSPRR